MVKYRIDAIRWLQISEIGYDCFYVVEIDNPSDPANVVNGIEIRNHVQIPYRSCTEFWVCFDDRVYVLGAHPYIYDIIDPGTARTVIMQFGNFHHTYVYVPNPPDRVSAILGEIYG